MITSHDLQSTFDIELLWANISKHLPTPILLMFQKWIWRIQGNRINQIFLYITIAQSSVFPHWHSLPGQRWISAVYVWYMKTHVLKRVWDTYIIHQDCCTVPADSSACLGQNFCIQKQSFRKEKNNIQQNLTNQIHIWVVEIFKSQDSTELSSVVLHTTCTCIYFAFAFNSVASVQFLQLLIWTQLDTGSWLV